jgi:hypothetical protein
VIVRRDRIEVEHQSEPDQDELGSSGNLMIPFSPATNAQKGITRERNGGHIDAVAREKLLNAIRRASRWVEAVRSREAKSFAEIAAQEGIGVRHVRWLTPLAFLSPCVVGGILDESIRAGPTVARLTRAPPYSWRLQDELFR